MRYQIQCVHLDEWSRNNFSGKPRITVVFDSPDHEKTLKHWENYESGLCDCAGEDPDNFYWGEPHCNQGYGNATFHRIVAYSDDEEIQEPTYEDSED